MKNLKIRSDYRHKYSTETFFKKLIAMKVQLKSISIALCGYGDDDYMAYELDEIPIISDLPNLKTLKILFGCVNEIQNTYQHVLHFKNLKHLHIQTCWETEIHDLSISVDNLHSLNLECGSNIESAMEFIALYKSVELLKFDGNMPKSINAFALLPKLLELEIFFTFRYVIIELLKSCNLLQKLTIQSRYDIQDIVQQTKFDISEDPDLKHQWKVAHEMDSCILIKVIPKA